MLLDTLLFIALFLLIDKDATRMTSFLSKMTGSDETLKKHSSYLINMRKIPNIIIILQSFASLIVSLDIAIDTKFEDVPNLL